MQFTPFNALYLAENEETAYREKFDLPTSKLTDGLRPHELNLRKENYAVYRVTGEIQNVFDLTKRNNTKPFVEIISRFSIGRDTNVLAVLAGLRSFTVIKNTIHLYRSLYDPWWRGWPRQHSIPANCQEFGKLVFEAGFEGILYESTRGSGENLAVFPEQLAGSGSYLELQGTTPPGCSITRLDSSSWRALV